MRRAMWPAILSLLAIGGQASAKEGACQAVPYKSSADSWWQKARDQADIGLIQNARRLCMQRTGSPGYSSSDIRCVSEDLSLWAQMRGIRPLVRPTNDPPRIEFRCTATILCDAPVKICRTEGPVRASPQ